MSSHNDQNLQDTADSAGDPVTRAGSQRPSDGEGKGNGRGDRAASRGQRWSGRVRLCG